MRRAFGQPPPSLWRAGQAVDGQVMSSGSGSDAGTDIVLGPLDAPLPDSSIAAIMSYSRTASALASAGSFGKPRVPKTLNEQLRI
jgi:hypothetical protein